MLSVRYRSQFKKDYRLMMKQGKDVDALDEIIRTLSIPELLDGVYLDHPLKGNYKGCRECHIEPDWLLIYGINEDMQELELVRTGSHAELFK